MKKCTVCKETKDFNKFYNRTASRDGKAYRCIACDDDARRKYQLTRTDDFKSKNRKALLKYRYNTTPEVIEDMLLTQEYKCRICDELPDKTSPVHKNLVVDHCHRTKEVRGLLCAKCNKALGLFKDSIKNLESAIKYLKESEINVN